MTEICRDFFLPLSCTGLTSVSIGSGVTSIGEYAFFGCTGLASAIFQGDAPSTFGSSTFDNTAPEFAIYYLLGSTGFASPTWRGDPTIQVFLALDLSPITSVSFSPAGTLLTIRVITLGTVSRKHRRRVFT